MKRRVVKIIFFLTLISSFKCSSSNEKLEIEKLYSQKGFEDKDGVFLKYKCEGANLFIEYGDDNVTKRLKDTFPCTRPSSRIPNLYSKNKDFILLSFGCGMPCWGVYKLPISNLGTIESFMYHLDYDGENKRILHIDYVNDSQSLILRSLIDNSTQEIKTNCSDTDMIGSRRILSAEINDNFINITTDINQDSSDIQQFQIKAAF